MFHRLKLPRSAPPPIAVGGETDSAETDVHRAGRHAGPVILWVLWAVVVLAFYYERLWRMLATGRSAWVVPVFPGLAWPLSSLPAAAARSAVAVAAASAVLLAVVALGAGLCALLRWRPEDRVDALLFRAGAGFGVLMYLSLGLAAVDRYTEGAVVTVLVLALLGGAVGLWRRGWSPRDAARRIASSRPRVPGGLLEGARLWQGVAVVAVLFAFVGAIAPESEFDALWYHLNLPKLALAEGHLVDLPHEYVSLFPLNWEFVFGAGLAVSGPTAAKLLHFACLPLTALAVFQLVRRFVPGASPWLAVALFVTVPTVLWEATTAYTDLALAFHTSLAVLALACFIERRSWPWFAMAALNLGIGLGTKHLALLVLLALVTVLVVCLCAHGERVWPALRTGVLLVGIALLLASPWYVRNWVASGNPVFPELYGVFGAPADRWDKITDRGLEAFQAHFGRDRTPWNLLTLPWDLTVHAARYGGAVGPLFLLVLPGLARRKRPPAVGWLLAFAALYFALWASPLSSFQLRHLVPVVPVLAVLGAAALSGVAGRGQRGGLAGAVCVGVAVLLVLNLPLFTPLHEADRSGNDGWLTHVVHQVPLAVVVGAEPRRSYLSRAVPSYGVWRYANAHLPPNARVLTFSGGDDFYSERQHIRGEATVARPATWGSPSGSEAAAREALARLGITHILFDRRQLDALEPGGLAIAEPEVITSWYDLEYEDGRFLLYSLHDSGRDAGQRGLR
jgi:hypothetical protein